MNTRRYHLRSAPRRARTCSTWLLLAAAVLAPCARPGSVHAQDRKAAPSGAPAADSTAARKGVSPRGALFRALALPGWGHAAIGAYNRGAFYFVLESATAWELVKTRERLLDARRRAAFREQIIRQDLAARGTTDPDSILAHLNGDQQLGDLNGLATARKSQQQDWIALGIFLVFLSGADAYVSAQLQHFPAPITLDAVPVGTSGRMQMSVGIHLPEH